jgi:hypothetical protein
LSGKEIISGLLLFLALGAGAGLIGYIANKAGRQEKPRAWLAGVVAIVAGLFFGYVVTDLILSLDLKAD